METLYQAYQSFESRVERDEFNGYRLLRKNRNPNSLPVGARLGDLLIRAGLRLKRRSAAGKPMAWSPLTGSKS
jgi:hypothetical protein